MDEAALRPITDTGGLTISSTNVAGFRVHALEARGSSTDPTSADSVLVAAHGDGVRLAVIDGVTALPETPAWMGLDGAVAGMATVRAALLHTDAVERCLRRANRELHRRDLPGRAQLQATVLVADVSAEGRVALVRGCDTEAWALEHGSWRCLFPPAPREWAIEAWRRTLDAEPWLRSDRVARWRRESTVWDDPDAWRSHPIGRFEAPRLEMLELDDGAWESLLLATDGVGTRERGPEEVDQVARRLLAGDGDLAQVDQGMVVVERPM